MTILEDVGSLSTGVGRANVINDLADLDGGGDGGDADHRRGVAFFISQSYICISALPHFEKFSTHGQEHARPWY